MSKTLVARIHATSEALIRAELDLEQAPKPGPRPVGSMPLLTAEEWTTIMRELMANHWRVQDALQALKNAKTQHALALQ